MGSCRGSTRPSRLNRIVKIISREVAAAQEGDPFHPSDETDRLLHCGKLVKIAVARQMINFIQIARPFFRLKNGFARRIAGRSQIIFPIVVRIRPLAAGYVRQMKYDDLEASTEQASYLNKVDHYQHNRLLPACSALEVGGVVSRSTRPSRLNRIVKIISSFAAQERRPFHPSDETDRPSCPLRQS